LATAHQIQGLVNVVSATAYQTRGGGIDSVGPVDFSGTNPVKIVVTANEGAENRQVSVLFVPKAREDYYKRLATVAEYFAPRPPQAVVLPPSDQWTIGHSTFFGQIWDGGINADGDSVKIALDPWTAPPGVSRFKHGTIALPNVADYILAPSHAPSAGNIYADTTIGHDPWVINLSQGLAPHYAIYGNPRDAAKFHVFPGGLTINVSGLVVWILPHGLYATNVANINGMGTLVIVAQANNDPAMTVESDVGIGFHGGLNTSPSVNVILATDARIAMEQWTNALPSTSAQHLSMYARSFDGMGPDHHLGGSLQQFLSYDPAMDAVIDQLYGYYLLPLPTSMTNSSWSMVPGSWRDQTP
jgi:hypothetical protein